MWGVDRGIGGNSRGGGVNEGISFFNDFAEGRAVVKQVGV
jgi:hypothetical protein